MFWTRKKLATAIMLASLSGVAQADLLVVTSAANANEKLSKSMVKKIFLKKMTTLPDGSKVVPVDFTDDNNVKWDFYQKVTRKNPAQVHSYWSRAIFTGIDSPPNQVKNANELKAMLSKNPNIIGYMDEKHIDKSVKVLYRIPS